jgi:hypothetical protein
VIYIGMEDPGDLNALDELSFRTGLKVRGVMVAPTELWETLDRSYRHVVEDQAAPDGPPDPGDTEPHLGAGLEPTEDRDALLPRSSAPRSPAMTPIGRLQPREEEAPTEAPEPSPEAGSAPGRVPTRTILRALTQLLLEKEVIGRDELRERIQAVADRED